jgi:hypothetical protein
MTMGYDVACAIGGTAVITGTGGYDPMLSSPSLNIAQGTYNEIVVGMMHSFATATSGTVQIYYITSDTSGWSGSRCIAGTPTVTPQSSGNNFVEYTFGLSSVTGVIT